MSTSDDQAVNEIRTTIKGFGEAYATGDLDRFLGFCTDDIVAMPPGMAPIVGMEDWKNLITGMFARSDRSDVVLITKDIIVVGDWAIEWHNEATTYTNKETGASERNYNKGMWIFRRDEGRWKIARYCWNSSPEVEPE